MPSGVYKRNKPVWNKGKIGVYSPEVIAKMKISRSGKKQSKQTIEKRVSKLRGVNHFLWKGGKVSYRGLHYWVSRCLGKPNYCAYCQKTINSKRGYHWANISHAYKRELSDWIRLCVSCHSKYDRGLINLNR